MKDNGEKKMLWKALAAVMTVLWILGSIIHGYAVKDMADLEQCQAKQATEIESLKFDAGLLQLTVENIDEKQDKIDATLTEVRDLVIIIEATIND